MRTLVLHDCDLNEQDGNSFSEANNKGKLPKLQNLDLSENCSLLSCFGSVASGWMNLKRLWIDYDPFPKAVLNQFELMNPLYEPLIEELRFTETTGLFPMTIGQWQHLKRLDIVPFTFQQCSIINRCLIDALEKGDLPALELVCLLTGGETGRRLSDETSFFAKLRRKDVDVFIIDPYLEKIMIKAGLSSRH